MFKDGERERGRERGARERGRGRERKRENYINNLKRIIFKMADLIADNTAFTHLVNWGYLHLSYYF